ncbi:hypothetical protein I6F35_37485 [Bradyrhizobium sp. BRP22]|uniref:hypothetical protein n=1 Tax=Bradyrhizobium sp. BRP22 TaxID=2793821 RepID=UPI00201BCB10|nr:hypothetical protein [Bradyrhizobium sp. BRP22]MCA1458790.1 hypothetical protein [Bradyrhizobium sp. BRP22]
MVRVFCGRDAFLLLLLIVIILGSAFVAGAVMRAGGIGLRGFHAEARRQAPPRRALASRPLKVPVLDQQKLVLADLIATRLVDWLYSLAGNRIDKLVFEAMARSPVDLPEGYPLRCRNCGIQRNGA